jgi:diguanylate cyclase (GGDEF)-like protein
MCAPSSRRSSIFRHVARLAWLALLAVGWRCPAQELTLDEYGQANGLRNMAVSALAQDAAGFVWAGTQNGLYRFDGARFERVGLEDGITSVTSLLADGDRLWIGANDGLWLLEHGRLRRVEGLSGYPQNVARAGDGNGVWIVDDWHLARLVRAPDGHWQRQDMPEVARLVGKRSVTSVATTAGGVLWFGCGKGLCKLDSGTLSAWGEDQGVPKDTWHWLLVASDGSIWARGIRHVLQRPPGSAVFVERADARDLADPLGLYPLAEDAQHRIVGAARGVLERWQGSAWDRFGPASGLPAGGRISALLTDREGGLWFGMLGAGVLRWRGYGQWENWSIASGLPHNAIWRFARAGASGDAPLHVATGLGVARFDASRRQFVPLPETRDHETYGLASDSDGTLWAGTASGTLMRWSPRRPGAPDRQTLRGAPQISDIFVQRSGELWVGTDNGLLHRSRYAGPGVPFETVDGADVGVGPFSSMCETPGGALWLTGDKGLRRLRQTGWDRPWATRSPPSALACLHDGSVLASDGTDGLWRLTPAGAGVRAVDATPAMLRGLVVQAILEDRRGWWWISTDAGVLVGNGNAWRLLDQASGLVWNDTSGGALFEDSDGSIWIGTSRGLSHLIAPETLFQPAVSLTFLRALRRGEQTYAAGLPLQLAWSPEPLEIDLEAPVYRDRALLRMEYRIAGFDDRWTPAGHLDVRLTGLPPGRYRFEARMIDRELGVPSASAALDIEIRPPWWRTSTALVAAASTTALLVWGLVRLRLRRHVVRERRLEAMVAERTRELEASHEQLRELATKDALTNVWNRRAVTEILAHEVLRCRREQMPLALVMSDIDHFKKVNDTHGHPVGDAVLREFASRLSTGLRPYDAVGRYGGEEFVIVMPGLDIRLPEHRARLEALHARIAATPMTIGRVTCSFGVAGSDGSQAVDADALVAAADAALYAAKHNGRDRIEWGGAPGATS